MAISGRAGATTHGVQSGHGVSGAHQSVRLGHSPGSGTGRTAKSAVVSPSGVVTVIVVGAVGAAGRYDNGEDGAVVADDGDRIAAHGDDGAGQVGANNLDGGTGERCAGDDRNDDGSAGW
jgi:hypothetical protein